MNAALTTLSKSDGGAVCTACNNAKAAWLVCMSDFRLYPYQDQFAALEVSCQPQMCSGQAELSCLLSQCGACAPWPRCCLGDAT